MKKSGNVAYERFLEYFDQARNASSVRSASLHRENTLSATDIGSSPLQSAMSSLSLVVSPSVRIGLKNIFFIGFGPLET